MLTPKYRRVSQRQRISSRASNTPTQFQCLIYLHGVSTAIYIAIDFCRFCSLHPKCYANSELTMFLLVDFYRTIYWTQHGGLMPRHRFAFHGLPTMRISKQADNKNVNKKKMQIYIYVYVMYHE